MAENTMNNLAGEDTTPIPSLEEEEDDDLVRPLQMFSNFRSSGTKALDGHLRSNVAPTETDQHRRVQRTSPLDFGNRELISMRFMDDPTALRLGVYFS